MKIAFDLLNFAMELGKSSYPKEFAGLLSADRGVISNLVILPGSASSRKAASIKLGYLPTGMKIIGSVHSHPSSNSFPSQADLRFFSKCGPYNLIVFYPFRKGDWRFYDGRGNPIDVQVIETEDLPQDQEIFKDLEELKREMDRDLEE